MKGTDTEYYFCEDGYYTDKEKSVHPEYGGQGIKGWDVSIIK